MRLTSRAAGRCGLGGGEQWHLAFAGENPNVQREHPLSLTPFAMHGQQATVAGDRVIARLVGLAARELRYIETAPLSRVRDADGRVWDVPHMSSRSTCNSCPVHLCRIVQLADERPQPVWKLRNNKLPPVKWTLVRGPELGVMGYDMDASRTAGYDRSSCTMIIEQQDRACTV